jgi:propanol-preferring alcohol dehydrogenase
MSTWTPGKMDAVVVRDHSSTIAVTSRTVPYPLRGEVLVKIHASGICHTDLHVAAGEYATTFPTPLTLGHEGAGEIVQAGPGSEPWAVGDRVIIGWLGWACGSCEPCRSGQEDVCERQLNPGWSVDGTMADYAIGRAHSLVRIPDGLSYAEAAPLGCAGVAAFSATRLAEPRPGRTVAVFGVGGLGHLAAQYVQAFGADVVAIDVADDRLALARELGASAVIDARTQDPVATLLERGGVHAAIAMAPVRESFEQALASLRPGGVLVVVAVPPEDEITVRVLEAVVRGQRIVGSPGGTRNDLEAVVALHGAGRARLVHQTRPLAEAPEAFADIEAGAVIGRVVLLPAHDR